MAYGKAGNVVKKSEFASVNNEAEKTDRWMRNEWWVGAVFVLEISIRKPATRSSGFLSGKDIGKGSSSETNICGRMWTVENIKLVTTTVLVSEADRMLNTQLEKLPQ